VLRFGFQSVRGSVRKVKDPVIPVHLAPTPSDVSGVSSVASGMLIFYHHKVTNLKTCGNIYLRPARPSGLKKGFDFFGLHRLVAIQLGKFPVRVLQFFFSHEPVFHVHFFHRVQPKAVVGTAQIFNWRHGLPCVTLFINITYIHQAACGEYLLFPSKFVQGFVFLPFNFPKSIHTAHIVNTVHASASGLKGFSFSTPTIESRVTSAASSSSLIPSVPCGRSGITI